MARKKGYRANNAENAEKRSCGIAQSLNYPSLSVYTGDGYAMRLSAVYRAVDIIAASIAQLPIFAKIRDVKGNGERIDSPLARLLNRRPDARMSRYTWIHVNIASMLLRGNGINLIERNRVGEVINLKYIDSNRCVINADMYNENVRYVIDGKEYQPQDVLHFINFSYDGIRGVSTLRAAANILEISANTDETARGFFNNGANVAGILSVQGLLTDEQKTNMQNSWRSAFSPASGHAGGIAVLEGNTTFQKVSLSAADAQLLQAREFNVIEIARFFGVNPVKLFDLSKSSYSTVEATQLSFLTDTLAPLLEKIEQELEYKLCEENIDLEFDTDKLLRNDKTSQASYLTSLVNGGILSPNEARAVLGYAGVEGGDEVQIQVNMQALNNEEENGTDEGIQETGDDTESAERKQNYRGLRSAIQFILSRFRRL